MPHDTGLYSWDYEQCEDFLLVWCLEYTDTQKINEC